MFNFTAFIRRKWSEYSNSSGQKGTVIDNLAIIPTGLVIQDFYNTLVDERKINDASNWKDMTEDQLDFFGNKFFTPRIYGDFAFGIVRIYFDEKKTIEITSDTRFTSDGGLEYKAVQPGYINSGSFIRSSDRFALYFVEFPIIATTKGNQYNVDAGVISQINSINFTYKMVTNPNPIISGSKFETNEQYYKRLNYSINDRSMMNKRSLFSRLPAFFPSIRSMYISSPGDRYMKRDLVEAVDISMPVKKSDYLGKTHAENMVESIAFKQIFPYEAGNQNGSMWNPLSIPTDYSYPLTIDPLDILSQEPAYHGYALNQEFEDSDYKGLFFDDFKTFAEVSTVDLYNIIDDQLGFSPVVVPSSDWIYGSHGMNRGNFGPLSDGSKDIDIINFTTNSMKLSGGSYSPVSVGKDIKKRIGVKVTGSFIWPNVVSAEDLTANSNLQIMVGGINGDMVDGFTGIGFGVRVTKPITLEDNEYNAILYFAHSERYQTIQVFGNDDDLGAITDTGALAETQFRIQSGIDYDFEFIIYDDLRLTLYINKTSSRVDSDPDERENTKHWRLPSTALNVYSQQLTNKSTSSYGTTMKVTLETESRSVTDTWTVNNLKAFDISEKKATALFALNVQNLEEPVSVFARASGSSSVDGLLGDGYIAYIWDKEAQSPSGSVSELTSGGWSELSGISNPDGSKNSLAALFESPIDNLDRYKVQNRFGNNIFIMLTTSGTTKMNSLYSGETEDDINSVLRIDYIKAENSNPSSYHANNKADIFLTTISNSEQLDTKTVILTKQANESFFEMSVENGCVMPVVDILSVTLGTASTTSQVLGSSDYAAVTVDDLYTGSSSEKIRITLTGYNSDSITVQYTSFPEIQNIQDFFNSPDFGKVFGNILVRHKFPIDLSFTIYYTGSSTDSHVIEMVKQYFDENNDGVFVVKDLISYLYNQKVVNNVQEPITISYTKYDDQNNIVSGEFNDKIEARGVDFFRVKSLSASKL